MYRLMLVELHEFSTLEIRSLSSPRDFSNWAPASRSFNFGDVGATVADRADFGFLDRLRMWISCPRKSRTLETVDVNLTPCFLVGLR